MEKEWSDCLVIYSEFLHKLTTSSWNLGRYYSFPYVNHSKYPAKRKEHRIKTSVLGADWIDIQQVKQGNVSANWALPKYHNSVWQRGVEDTNKRHKINMVIQFPLSWCPLGSTAELSFNYWSTVCRASQIPEAMFSGRCICGAGTSGSIYAVLEFSLWISLIMLTCHQPSDRSFACSGVTNEEHVIDSGLFLLRLFICLSHPESI